MKEKNPLLEVIDDIETNEKNFKQEENSEAFSKILIHLSKC